LYPIDVKHIERRNTKKLFAVFPDVAYSGKAYSVDETFLGKIFCQWVAKKC